MVQQSYKNNCPLLLVATSTGRQIYWSPDLLVAFFTLPFRTRQRQPVTPTTAVPPVAKSSDPLAWDWRGRDRVSGSDLACSLKTVTVLFMSKCLFLQRCLLGFAAQQKQQQQQQRSEKGQKVVSRLFKPAVRASLRPYQYFFSYLFLI